MAIRRIFRVDRSSWIAEGENDIDHAHSPDRALLDQGARLTRHWESCIAMREAKEAIVIADKADKFLRFSQIARHRLFADDVNSAFKKPLGDRKMELRRGRDDHRVNPVGTLGLALHHDPPIGVRLSRIDHLRQC